MAIVTAYALAASSFRVLRSSSEIRLPILAALATGIGLTPWMVGPDQRVARFLVSIYAAALMLKLWDLHVGAFRSKGPRAWEFFRFLANLPSLVHRRTGFEAQPAARVNAVRLIGSGAVCWFGVYCLFLFLQLNWGGIPFLFEHIVKAGAFFVAASAAFTATAAAARLLGWYAPEPIRRPLAARTPAEFWRRYNRWIGEALREDVFRPVGGLRSPVRSTLVVFIVSGLLHEYVFAAAVGQIQGLQLAFFLLQGIAVILTLKVRPPKIIGVAGTVTFNALTSILFFSSVHAVFPFYHDGPPAWLGGG